jgi:hypothetical protein
MLKSSSGFISLKAVEYKVKITGSSFDLKGKEEE